MNPEQILEGIRQQQREIDPISNAVSGGIVNLLNCSPLAGFKGRLMRRYEHTGRGTAQRYAMLEELSVNFRLRPVRGPQCSTQWLLTVGGRVLSKVVYREQALPR